MLIFHKEVSMDEKQIKEKAMGRYENGKTMLECLRKLI